MYKLVVYRNSRIIGYVFVQAIGTRDYPAIYAEVKRALQIKYPANISFMLAN